MPGGLNIAFAGTPELAATILTRLLDDGRHDISMALSQPDRPAGRGKKTQQSALAQLANSRSLPLFQPGTRLALEALGKDISKLDVLVVAAYGMILPENILRQPRYGCINIHTSLLPRWRGAAPIQHAILAGDNETGITIMQMDAGLDTGDILYQESCPIYTNDTSGTLHERLAELGGQCVLTTLEMFMKNQIHAQTQDNTLATYANKIQKQDAKIDWSNSANEIHRLIRAMNPAPVAYTELNNTVVRIWEAEILDLDTATMQAGTIISNTPRGLDISTMDKAIRILKLQLPGKKALTFREFYNGYSNILIGSANLK